MRPSTLVFLLICAAVAIAYAAAANDGTVIPIR
jgi:hypothetical protein